MQENNLRSYFKSLIEDDPTPSRVDITSMFPDIEQAVKAVEERKLIPGVVVNEVDENGEKRIIFMPY